MKEAENFEALLTGLMNGDSAAKSAITLHIGIIIRNWCRKNKKEITWMLANGKIENELKIYKMVLTGLETALRKKSSEIKSYTEYKKFVIEKSNQYLSERFISFNEALIQSRNKPWQMVERTMWKFAVKWLADRNIYNNVVIQDLHFETLRILFEKIKQKELHFASSCELKSYYFKILELKWKELLRNNIKNRRYTDEIPDVFVNDNIIDLNPLIGKIKKYISQLDADEQYILKAYYFFEKKLTEIAEDLEISSENCRVMKLRALRKLSEMIPRNILNDYS